MMRTSIFERRVSAAFAAAALMVAATGCSNVLVDRIVDLRNAQADAALANHNTAEAENEYGLALRLAPKNEHARAGLVRALYLRAQENYANGKINDAALEVQRGLTYAPKDAGLLDLASVIDQAKIRRDVLVGNFPTYKAMGDSISELLSANAMSSRDIQRELHLFRTDYDVVHLRRAIELSALLEDEQHRVTQRLVAYKGQIETGAPVEARPSAQSESPGLLPIP